MVSCLVLGYPSFSAARDANIFAIGEVEIGMTSGQVVALIGKPTTTEDHDGFFRVTYHYALRSVTFDESLKVSAAQSTSPDFCLSPGICPGMKWGEVRGKLAGWEIHELNEETLKIHGDGCWARATAHAGRVAVVEFSCTP